MTEGLQRCIFHKSPFFQQTICWFSNNPKMVVTLKTSNFAPASSKEFLATQATIECWFTLKRVCHMIRTYSQMHRTDKYSKRSSIIWPVWLNGWVFDYGLSGCGFESSCSPIFLGQHIRVTIQSQMVSLWS